MRWLVPLAVRAPISLVAALLFVRLVDEWFSFYPAGALVPIRDDLGLSYAQSGLLLAALPAGGILGHGFTLAADYVSRRLLASLGALVYGLYLLTFAVADSFAVLLAASFVAGMASDAFVHGCEVALVDLAEDDLAPALARVNAFGSVGDLLGPIVLAGAAAAGLGWRPVFASGGVLMLLYAAWLGTQRFPPPRPPEHAATPWASVRSVLGDRRVIVLALAAGLFGLLDEPLLAFTIAYLERVRGLPAAAATVMAGIVVAGGLVGFLCVSFATRRWRVRPLLIGAGVVVGLAVTAMMAVPPAPLVALAGFTFGVAGAVFWSVLQAAYLGLRPGQAGATGAVVSTIGLFGVPFPSLVGAVADRFGLTAGLGLYAAVPVVMLALLIRVPVGADD